MDATAPSVESKPRLATEFSRMNHDSNVAMLLDSPTNISMASSEESELKQEYEQIEQEVASESKNDANTAFYRQGNNTGWEILDDDDLTILETTETDRNSSSVVQLDNDGSVTTSNRVLDQASARQPAIVSDHVNPGQQYIETSFPDVDDVKAPLTMSNDQQQFLMSNSTASGEQQPTSAWSYPANHQHRSLGTEAINDPKSETALRHLLTEQFSNTTRPAPRGPILCTCDNCRRYMMEKRMSVQQTQAIPSINDMYRTPYCTACYPVGWRPTLPICRHVAFDEMRHDIHQYQAISANYGRGTLRNLDHNAIMQIIELVADFRGPGLVERVQEHLKQLKLPARQLRMLGSTTSLNPALDSVKRLNSTGILRQLSPKKSTRLRLSRLSLWRYYKSMPAHVNVAQQPQTPCIHQTSSIDRLVHEIFPAPSNQVNKRIWLRRRGALHMHLRIGQRWDDLIQYLGLGSALVCGPVLAQVLDAGTMSQSLQFALIDVLINLVPQARDACASLNGLVESILNQGYYLDESMESETFASLRRFAGQNNQLDLDSGPQGTDADQEHGEEI